MPTTFTVGHNDLKRVYDRLAPYVGDDSRPVLACIRLEAGKDGLTAVAADGFILGSQTVGYYDKPKWARGSRPPLTILVPPAQLKLAVAAAPKYGVVTITVTDSGWRVNGHGQAVHLTPQEGSYPDYSQCLPALKEMGRFREPMSYMPRQLLRAVKGLGDTRVHLWSSGRTSPTIIATGDGFWGVIMPAVPETSSKVVELALAPGLSDGERIVRKYRRQERKAQRQGEEEAARRLAEASEEMAAETHEAEIAA